MPKATFERDKRLLTARNFQAVFDDTQLKVARPQLLFLARPNQLQHPRLGMVIAKKNIRRAVDRNRIKRVVRDTFRVTQHQLGSVDIIFLARKGIEKLSPSDQTALLQQCWLNLAKKVRG